MKIAMTAPDETLGEALIEHDCGLGKPRPGCSAQIFDVSRGKEVGPFGELPKGLLDHPPQPVAAAS
jgi:hypothetical protein